MVCGVFASRGCANIKEVYSANSSSFCGNVQKIVDKLCSTRNKYLIEIDCSSWQQPQNTILCQSMHEGERKEGRKRERAAAQKSWTAKQKITSEEISFVHVWSDAMHLLSAFFDLKNLISNKSDSKWHPVWTWWIELSFHSFTHSLHSQSCMHAFSHFCFLCSGIYFSLSLLLFSLSLPRSLFGCWICDWSQPTFYSTAPVQWMNTQVSKRSMKGGMNASQWTAEKEGDKEIYIPFYHSICTFESQTRTHLWYCQKICSHAGSENISKKSHISEYGRGAQFWLEIKYSLCNIYMRLNAVNVYITVAISMIKKEECSTQCRHNFQIFVYSNRQDASEWIWFDIINTFCTIIISLPSFISVISTECWVFHWWYIRLDVCFATAKERKNVPIRILLVKSI